MLYSTGPTHRIVYATSRHPLGPFSYRGVVLEEVSGWTTQGSAVEWRGTWYYLHHDSECSLGETARRCVKVSLLEYEDHSKVASSGSGTMTFGPSIRLVHKGYRLYAASSLTENSNTIAVLNGITRTDERGHPLNAHQGSMSFDISSRRFYLYGNYHRDCVSTIHCHCEGAEEGWTVTTGIGIYSATSLAGPWRKEAGPILAPFNQPRVIGPFRDSTSGAVNWRMYMQFPLRLAISNSPAGPFTLTRSTVHLDYDPQDMHVFLDDEDHGRQVSYIIYTSSADYRIRVQRLSADGSHGVVGEISEPFGPQPCEAPALFRHSKGAYFAIFGHNCWCCQEVSARLCAHLAQADALYFSLAPSSVCITLTCTLLSPASGLRGFRFSSCISPRAMG